MRGVVMMAAELFPSHIDSRPAISYSNLLTILHTRVTSERGTRTCILIKEFRFQSKERLNLFDLVAQVHPN